MFLIRPRTSGILVLLLALPACGPRKTGGAVGCGVTALAGPSLLLEEFARPGTVLSEAPDPLPAALPVRIAAGPVFRSVVGRAETGWVIGVEGELPAQRPPGFGVLVVGPSGSEGVLLYEGDPVQGAPVLGSVHAGTRQLPLIGLRADPTRFGDAACPIFPDSLRR